MLNQNQINLLPERVVERLRKANTEYLESIGNVIKKIGELRPSDVHQLQQMYDYGADLQRVTLRLAEVSGKNIQDIYDIFDVVAKDNYNYAKPFYEARAIPYVPYEKNEKLKQYVRSIAKQTVGEYVNLTQSTAFSVFAKDGKSIAPLFATNKDKVATSLSDTYNKIIDYAVSKVQLGEEGYQSAMRKALKSLAGSGIKTVEYATGYTRRLDSAVRQNILWGVKQCNQNTADFIGEEFGADGYEISYHSNPRLSHADMAGKVFAIGGARTVNGVFYPSFEEVAEPLLKEYGCLHFKFPVILGISRPAYDKEQLEELKASDNKTFEFEGKKYTKYEGEQLQRKIETAVRRQKDFANIAKAAGNIELQQEAQRKINLLAGKYDKLSKASGLPTKMERMNVVKTNISSKTIALEQTTFISKKEKGTFPVDRTLVNTKKFHDKFEGCTTHKSVNEALYQETMKMLEHRDGTEFEDLAAIDARTGEIIAKNTTINIPGKVYFTDEQYEACMQHDGEILLLHNHPNGSRPSYADISTVYNEKKVVGTISVGHDGDVHIVTDLEYNKNIDKIYDAMYNEYKEVYKDSDLAKIKATDYLYYTKLFKYRRR